jgi:hypothetical protein
MLPQGSPPGWRPPGAYPLRIAHVQPGHPLPQLVEIGTITAREAPQQAAGQHAQSSAVHRAQGVSATHPRRDVLVVLLRVDAPGAASQRLLAWASR